MTAFDPFEQRIAIAIDQIADARLPDYLDEALARTRRVAQRPRWTFPSRWVAFPAGSTAPRQGAMSAVPVLALLLVLGLLVALTMIALFGGTRRLPAPYSGAANGEIVYSASGDLYVRDSLLGAPRLLIGGPGEQSSVTFSPDGHLMAYLDGDGAVDHVMVAYADGSGSIQILSNPFANGTGAWSPDSRTLAITAADSLGMRQLWLAPADGSGARLIDLHGLTPWDAVWSPAGGDRLLVRGEDAAGTVDLYLTGPGGSNPRPLHRTGAQLFGPEYALSGSVFSPDARSIAYNVVVPVDGSEVTGRFTVHVMDADGTNDRILPLPSDVSISQAWPIFSPDGSLIAMQSWVGQPRAGGKSWLAIVPANGSEPPRKVGPEIVDDLVKVWSPDQTTLLLQAANTRKLFEVDVATGEARPLDWSTDLPDWQRTAP